MAQLLCFDALREMAESDPKGFEQYREAICNDFIDSIPAAHQQRLRAVQFRVNRVIYRAKTPMAGLIKVSGMMHDSLNQLSTRLLELNDAPFQQLRPQPQVNLADVVDLRAWQLERNLKQH